MIIRQENKLLYTTRQYYGTSIEIVPVYKVEDTEKKNLIEIKFAPGKIREIEMPETKEDKKVFLVMAAVKELMKETNKEDMNAIIYGQKVKFSKKDSEGAMFGKIFQALSISLNSQNKVQAGIFASIQNILKEALWKGEIDVF